MAREKVPTDPRESSFKASPNILQAGVVEVDASQIDEAELGVSPVSLNLLSSLRDMPVDLMVPRMDRASGVVEMVQFARRGSRLSQKARHFLQEQGIEFLYYPREQGGDLATLVSRLIKSVVDKEGIPLETKSRVLYDAALLLAVQASSLERLPQTVKVAGNYLDQLVSFVGKSPQAIQGLAQMLALDYTLYTHAVNVCMLAVSYGTYIKLSSQEVYELGLGALFHDVGKLAICQDLVVKPGPLSEDEWARMRRHPQHGYDLLKGAGSFPLRSLNIVRQHHEDLDGHGYPLGLQGRDISSLAKIVRVIDTYDAITSQRAYKPAVEAFQALLTMNQEMQGKYSPQVLRTFVALLGFLGERSRSSGPSLARLKAL